MKVEIEKRLVQTVKIDDSELTTGDVVKFTDGKKINFGEFKGITNKGGLIFGGKVGKTTAEYVVMPSSIVDLEVIEHRVE